MANGPVTWDILITTIPHRRHKLRELTFVLGVQLQPGVAVRICDDNLQAAYGDKCGALLASSQADYVSFVDDDDMVAENFVPRITRALKWQPDYVGFPVVWTVDGVPQVPVEHSLRHNGWKNTPERLTRDIVHFNPIRRELALLGTWSGGYAADRRWAGEVRESGRVKREQWITQPMYFYRNSAVDHFMASRKPAEPGQITPLPKRPWITEVPPP